jgi:flagellar hook-associated protein 2
MSITSSTTPTLTSLGVGSGLQAESIVTKLVALERRPISALQDAADKIQSKISAFGQVKSNLSTIRDAAQKLANPSIWSSTTSSSSDTSVANFTTSSGAATGSYSVSVSALASGQSVVTKTALSASTATVGSGTLTFDVGPWDGTTLTPSKTTSVNIAATDTLENVRDKINDASTGVTASIVKDANGARLVMTSTATGAANAFRISVNDTGDGNNTDASGLSALGYDPASAMPGTTQTKAATDAAATINGVSVTSSTNNFAEVLTGISFTVGKLTTNGTLDTPATVTVKQDNDTIAKAINEFASSYSSLVTLLRNNTKYDDATKTAGTLQGDSTAVGILNQLRSTIGGTAGNSSVFAALSSIGVEMQSGGTLTVNNTKLTNALGKLTEVKKLFANTNLTDGSKDGVATKLRALSDNILGFDGALTSRTAGLNKSIQNNQKRQDDLDNRASLYEKRLRAQYTALDRNMAGLNSTSSYVSQMITNWNKA